MGARKEGLVAASIVAANAKGVFKSKLFIVEPASTAITCGARLSPRSKAWAGQPGPRTPDGTSTRQTVDPVMSPSEVNVSWPSCLPSPRRQEVLLVLGSVEG